MRVKVRGRYWNLEFVSRLPRGGGHQDDYGRCDSPTTEKKSILVLSKLRGRERLEILIHELFHAGCWDLDEEAVEEIAGDIARVLDNLGYRCDEEDKD